MKVLILRLYSEEYEFSTEDNRKASRNAKRESFDKQDFFKQSLLSKNFYKFVSFSKNLIGK